MILLDDTYLKCPNCDNHFAKTNWASANTFGSIIYSDSYRDAPMFPKISQLEQCTKCTQFSWTKDLAEIETLPIGSLIQYKSELTLNQLEQALNYKLYRNREEEFYLRLHLWWAFNDRVRNGNPLFENADEEISWGKNLNSLLNLLDNKIPEHRIFELEIQRNFGNFEEAMKLIKTIPHDFKNISAQFEYHILAQNRAVFQLEL